MEIVQETNPQFELAADFIQYTNKNIFLTGKAGTGKTTFLKHIKKISSKNIAIIAPTGVAAINAGGATIHSFFQLPFSPFLPERNTVNSNNTDVSSDKYSLINKLKYTQERRDIIATLDLLVIDEISMVRCDTLDAIDTILRHFRTQRNEPFGGVQMLFIGDLFQLPPVMPDQDWKILSPYYRSPYFFESHTIKENPLIQVELMKIYRQSDKDFINLLNQIRNNELDEFGIEMLQTLTKPNFEIPEDESFIQLTTHNNKADFVNDTELQKVNSVPIIYTAEIKGEFYEKSFPAEQNLLLKKGAQVMFVKNDTEKIKRYFNGKIGTITDLADNEITIDCVGEAPILLKRDTWKNIKYKLSSNAQNIDEEEVGSFTQFPLRLAWAITIHKSQGLTFEKAVIDAGSAFSPGQVYVAMSRCTNLDGIVLKTAISQSSISVNWMVAEYVNQNTKLGYLNNVLQDSKSEFEKSTLLELFNLKNEIYQCNKLRKSILDFFIDNQSEPAKWIDSIMIDLNNLQVVCDKFQNEMHKLFDEYPVSDEYFQNRISKGCTYFIEKLEPIENQIRKPTFFTDNKTTAKEINKILRELAIKFYTKTTLFKASTNSFDLNHFMLEKKKSQGIDISINIYGGAKTQTIQKNIPNIELFKKLKSYRDQISESSAVPIYMIAASGTLEEMCNILPTNEDTLKLIKGFGDIKVKKYGFKFIEIISQYCYDHNLESNNISLLDNAVKEKKPKVEKTENLGNSKQASFDMFKLGKSIEEIATERNFAQSTIEGHLIGYIKSGEIGIEQFVKDPELIETVQYLSQSIPEGQTKLTYIKQNMEERASYSQIKMILAHLGID